MRSEKGNNRNSFSVVRTFCSQIDREKHGLRNDLDEQFRESQRSLLTVPDDLNIDALKIDDDIFNNEDYEEEEEENNNEMGMSSINNVKTSMFDEIGERQDEEDGVSEFADSYRYTWDNV